ncbi:MAG: hypothetical protein GXP36_10605 [Actinobacteria bacterium]|nr:hypothetical protein [Actinomycetota bacterium]
MFRNPRPFAILTALALVVAACSGTSTSETTSTSRGDADTVTTAGAEAIPPDSSSAPIVYEPLPIDEAVAALEDPDTAVQGVLGILDELNIGVYTTDGIQILAGSETGPDDLYVLAELLPGLAVATQRPGPTMGQYITDLETVLQSGLSPEELAAAYPILTATLPDYPMSRVLEALDVDFSPDARLTRFEAWLLMLVWVPPNGGTAQGVGTAQGAGPIFATAIPAALTTAAVPAAEVRCPATGDGSKPGYDLASVYGSKAKDEAGKALQDLVAEGAVGESAEKTATWLKGFGEVVAKYTLLLDGAKIAQIMANTDIRVNTEPISTHEVHTTEGETYEDKLVEVTVDVIYLGSTAATEGACAYVGMLGLPDPNTPIENAQVDFYIDNTLREHGYARHRVENGASVRFTNANGRWTGWFQPKDEKPDSAQKLSDAFIHKAQGTFGVTVSVTTAMGQLFNPFSGIELFGLYTVEGEITVGWHDPAARIEIENSMGGFTGVRRLTLETCDGQNWSGNFFVDGKLVTPQGRAQVTAENPVEVTVDPASGVGEGQFSFDRVLEGAAADATFEADRTQPTQVSFELRDDGMVMATLNFQPGSQVVTAHTPDGSVSVSAPIEPWTEVYTGKIEPATCDG